MQEWFLTHYGSLLTSSSAAGTLLETCETVTCWIEALVFYTWQQGCVFPHRISTQPQVCLHTICPPPAAYVNCRVMVWTTDRAPGEKTQSAVGARLHPLGPNLRADCHSGMLSYWRSLLGRVVFFFFCDPRRIWRAFWWEGDWRAFLFFITTFYHAGSYTLAPSYFMRPFWR